jgi:hypothetical protein
MRRASSSTCSELPFRPKAPTWGVSRSATGGVGCSTQTGSDAGKVFLSSLVERPLLAHTLVAIVFISAPAST